MVAAVTPPSRFLDGTVRFRTVGAFAVNVENFQKIFRNTSRKMTFCLGRI